MHLESLETAGRESDDTPLPPGRQGEGAIGIDGALRPRFDVMKRWGTFTHDFEADFSSSEEIEDAVTVLNDGAYAVPQAGTRDDMQALYAAEYPGVFGWLVTSGFDPKVGELSRADSALACSAVHR